MRTRLLTTLTTMLAALPGCSGEDGVDGRSCTVVEEAVGAVLRCEDGTSVVIRDGKDGRDGQDGVDGRDGAPALIAESAEGAGENCAQGGSRIDYGTDTDGDGTLDEEEITGTAYVCNGAQTLLNTRDEPPGANCPAGGRAVESGVDANGNGVLDPKEVTDVSYACHGNDGADGADGADGVDGTDGADGGPGTLVSITAEPPGANCAAGGQRIDTGVDQDSSGVLEASEVTSTSYVCNGEDGQDGDDGVSAVVAVTKESPGANCANGGTRVQSGLDADGDGVLDAGEVQSTAYVCDLLHPVCFGSYHTFTDGRRNVTNTTGAFCDGPGSQIEWQGPGWYRFTGAAGTRMPESAPPTFSCGANAPGWLDGGHPAASEGVVSRRICFHWSSDTCAWEATAEVVNCGNFYLYSLPNVPVCSSMYCGTS